MSYDVPPRVCYESFASFHIRDADVLNVNFSTGIVQSCEDAFKHVDIDFGQQMVCRFKFMMGILSTQKKLCAAVVLKWC